MKRVDSGPAMSSTRYESSATSQILAISSAMHEVHACCRALLQIKVGCFSNAHHAGCSLG